MNTEIAVETASNLVTADRAGVVLTHCACCGKRLKDAVSVQRGIGPDCYGQHYDAGIPGLSEEGWGEVMDLVMSGDIARFVPALSTALEAAYMARDNRAIANLAIAGLAVQANQLNLATGQLVQLIRLCGFERVAARCQERLGKLIVRQQVILARQRAEAARKGASRSISHYVGGAAEVEITEASAPIWGRITGGGWVRAGSQAGYRVVVRNLSKAQFGAYLAAIKEIPGRSYERETQSNLLPLSARAVLWTALKVSVPGATLVTRDGRRVIPDMAH